MTLTLAIGAVLLLAHVVLGAALYFALEQPLRHWVSPERFFVFATGFSLFFMLVRMVRFSDLENAFETGAQRSRGLVSVFLLLGPAETLIPLLTRSGQLGAGFLVPVLGFAAGTLAVGLLTTAFGRMLCSRPNWLTLGLDWFYRPVAMAPLAAGAALGLLLVFGSRLG